MISKKRRSGSSTIAVFVALNFVLGGLCLLWLLLFLCVLIYGVFYSGDKGEELFAGVMGSVILGFPGLIGVIVYMIAGLGLLKRWKLGYYLHLVGAVLAAFSCIGLIYTIFAFIYAFRPGFFEEFSPASEMEAGFSAAESKW